MRDRTVFLDVDRSGGHSQVSPSCGLRGCSSIFTSQPEFDLGFRTMNLPSLFQEFCDFIAIGSIEPDANGVATIVFDAGLNVEFVALSDRQFLVRSKIADVPENQDERNDFYRTHLQHNMLIVRDQFASLALDDDSKILWLFRTVDSRKVDVRTFSKIVEDFVNTVEWWKQIESRQKADAGFDPRIQYTMLRP